MVFVRYQLPANTQLSSRLEQVRTSLLPRFSNRFSNLFFEFFCACSWKTEESAAALADMKLIDVIIYLIAILIFIYLLLE